MLGSAIAILVFLLVPEHQVWKAELLKLHQEDRRAHFEGSVNAIVSNQAETFIAVSSGKIHQETAESTRRFFADYFAGAEYLEWDDLEPPIIRISADGSMAWMITRLKVRRIQKIGSEAKEQKFVYAGIMTYERRDAKWIRTANVSTFEPTS